MLDFLLLGFAIVLWACYCCRRRRGVQGLRRVPILTPKPFMSEEDRLALIEKQLVTVKIASTPLESVCNLVISAQSLYEANCCNCTATATTNDKDILKCNQTKENYSCSFDPNLSQRSVFSRALSAASTTIAQQRQDECIICFEEYKEGDDICWAKTDQCQHVFHKRCAVEWLKRDDNCPLCRVNIVHARTVTYEEDVEDDEAAAAAEATTADLELGEGPDENNGEEENGDEESADLSSIELKETSEMPKKVSESLVCEEHNSLAEGLVEHDLEEQATEDVAVAMSPPSSSADTNQDASDEEAEELPKQQYLKVMPTKSVDFAGFVHTNEN